MLRSVMRKLIRSIFGRLGFVFLFDSSYQAIITESGQSAESKMRFENLRSVATVVPHPSLEQLIKLSIDSKSQIGQDLWVIANSNFKQSGVFIEIGAHDGIHLSNTYFLEKYFQWDGIIVEPAVATYQLAKALRTCSVVNSFVASSSGKVINFFTSTKSEYSTRTDLIDSDYHSVNRLYGSKGTILTISLNDLLLTHDVPTAIDYISIDTEGSELEILSTFDFNKYKVRLWTV